MPNRGWSALRTRAERGPSANYVRLKDGQSVVVRFIASKEEDVVYFRQHYINNKYRICQDDTEDFTGECQWCDEDDKPGELYAFNVIDRTDGKVKVLQLAIGHATQILEFYDEYNTISDRDYKITRHGNQSQTRYTFVARKELPMDAADRRLAKEKYDLEELYAPVAVAEKPKKKRVTDETKTTTKSTKKQVVEEDDEDEEEEKPAPRKRKVEEKPSAAKKKAPPPEDDEDDDDDDLDEEDDEDSDDEDSEDEEEDSEDDDEEEDDEDSEDDDDEEDDEESEDDDEEFDLDDE